MTPARAANDTADPYGPKVSEESHRRGAAFLSGRSGRRHHGWTRTGRRRAAGSRRRSEHLRQACECSQRRLLLDQIPLYQFHRPDPAVPLEDSIIALVALKDEGKIRDIGLSSVNEDQLLAQALTPIVSIQNRYNPGDRSSDALVDLCVQEHMAFLPWAPVQNLDQPPPVTRIAERQGATAYRLPFGLAARPVRNDADDPRYWLGPTPRGERGRRWPASGPSGDRSP
jgi:pyridoxine 4-dehydrogenase